MSPIWRNNWVGNRTQHSPTHIGNCAPNGGVRWDGLISIVTPQRRRTHSTSPWIIHILQYTIQSGSCQVFTLPCREHDGPGAVRRRARAIVVLPLLFCDPPYPPLVCMCMLGGLFPVSAGVGLDIIFSHFIFLCIPLWIEAIGSKAGRI